MALVLVEPERSLRTQGRVARPARCTTGRHGSVRPAAMADIWSATALADRLMLGWAARPSSPALLSYGLLLQPRSRRTAASSTRGSHGHSLRTSARAQARARLRATRFVNARARLEQRGAVMLASRRGGDRYALCWGAGSLRLVTGSVAFDVRRHRALDCVTFPL
jgi:hypothetical protein